MQIIGALLSLVFQGVWVFFLLCFEVFKLLLIPLLILCGIGAAIAILKRRFK